LVVVVALVVVLVVLVVLGGDVPRRGATSRSSGCCKASNLDLDTQPGMGDGHGRQPPGLALGEWGGSVLRGSVVVALAVVVAIAGTVVVALAVVAAAAAVVVGATGAVVAATVAAAAVEHHTAPLTLRSARYTAALLGAKFVAFNVSEHRWCAHQN
jgi:hypothetical protein